jgi:hypothetical protein
MTLRKGEDTYEGESSRSQYVDKRRDRSDKKTRRKT